MEEVADVSAVGTGMVGVPVASILTVAVPGDGAVQARALQSHDVDYSVTPIVLAVLVTLHVSKVVSTVRVLETSLVKWVGY